MQTYARGDLRLGHLAYIVLGSLLLTHMFPDPDVLCFLLRSDQIRVVEWFLRRLRGAVRDSEVDARKAEYGTSGVELTASLRVRDPDTDKLWRTGSLGLGRWIQAMPPWPVVTKGGCRYLFQARRLAPEQYILLDSLSPDKVYKNIPFYYRTAYVNFGIPESEFESLDYNLPALGRLGLEREPGLTSKLLDVDPSIGYARSRVSKLAVAQARPTRLVLSGWARLNPAKIPALLMKVGGERFAMRLY